MTRLEFARAVNNRLRELDARKPVSVPKHKFYIRDDDGNETAFTVSQNDKRVIYTYDDVKAVIDAALDVIEDAIRNGEEITIRGFGTLGLHKRAARRVKQPGTNDWYEVSERMVPKFWYGNILRMAANAYNMNHKELFERFHEDGPMLIEDLDTPMADEDFEEEEELGED